MSDKTKAFSNNTAPMIHASLPCFPGACSLLMLTMICNWVDFFDNFLGLVFVKLYVALRLAFLFEFLKK